MHQKELLNQTIEHDKFIAVLRTDGIVHIFFKDSAQINIPLQNEMVEVYYQLCEKKNILLFLK